MTGGRHWVKRTNERHGATRQGVPPEYRAWSRIRERCGNPKCKDYPDYGGRGIKVCDRWTLFSNFLADMGPHPGRGYEIDRVNNDLGYGPDNCRWATRLQQMGNTRRTRRYRVNGESVTARQYADRCGMTYEQARNRLMVMDRKNT